MIRLKILNSYYKIIDGYNITESSREVKFNTIKIEFTDKTIADLPKKYQEVQLLDLDSDYNINKIIFTGYINNFKLPNMKNKHEYRELELDLLSPLAMATVRTVDAVGTYQLQTLVKELIQPLINDGFVLKELNIGNNQITVNYQNETVESSLNKLSNKFNIWWYINANKEIFINSISYLLNLKPKLIYDDNNKINGLIDVIPSIDATDYCNVVNFTNVRLKIIGTMEYYDDTMHGYYPLFSNIKLSQGIEIEFNYPIIINAKNELNRQRFFILEIFAGNSANFDIYINRNNEIVIPNNVTISDSYSDENEWVLVRDSFFKNLIVGLKYNGTSTDMVNAIYTQAGLIWAKVKIQDNNEINKNKGIISQSGIVEKQIDMNEQWKEYQELVEIANSYIKVNSSKADTVKLNIDEDTGLNIGDTIYIDKEDFLIQDTYIITDKSTINEFNTNRWEYTLKNANMIESYIDLFRASESQDNTDKNINLITSDYIEEGFNEKYEVVINEN